MKKKTTNGKARHGPSKGMTPQQIAIAKKVNAVLAESLNSNDGNLSPDEVAFILKCKITIPPEEELKHPEVDKSTIKAPFLFVRNTNKGMPSLLEVIAVISYSVTECILHKLGIHF